MKSEFVPRDGTFEDLESFMKLAVRAYSEYKNQHSEKNWNILLSRLENISFYREMMETCTSIVCEMDDRLVGGVVYMPPGIVTEHCPPASSYIKLLSVDPEYRRMGIGKGLLKECIRKAIDHGDQEISLHTADYMNTKELYESLGFRVSVQFMKYGNVNRLYSKSLSGV